MRLALARSLASTMARTVVLYRLARADSVSPERTVWVLLEELELPELEELELPELELLELPELELLVGMVAGRVACSVGPEELLEPERSEERRVGTEWGAR